MRQTIAAEPSAIADAIRQFIKDAREIARQFGPDHRERPRHFAETVNQHNRRSIAPQRVATKISAGVERAGPTLMAQPRERNIDRNIGRGFDGLFGHLSNAMLAKLTLSKPFGSMNRP